MNLFDHQILCLNVTELCYHFQVVSCVYEPWKGYAPIQLRFRNPGHSNSRYEGARPKLFLSKPRHLSLGEFQKSDIEIPSCGVLSSSTPPLSICIDQLPKHTTTSLYRILISPLHSLTQPPLSSSSTPGIFNRDHPSNPDKTRHLSQQKGNNTTPMPH